MKIMFVCHGNICRSPMAEFIFKKKAAEAGLSDEFLICSSATSTEEIWNGVGNPVYPPAKAELKKHGITCVSRGESNPRRFSRKKNGSLGIVRLGLRE